MDISSKLINLQIMKGVIPNCTTDTGEKCDGIIILTAFGYVEGELMLINPNIPKEEDTSILRFIKETRKSLIERDNGIEPVYDGSLISIKNATAHYSNGLTLYSKEMLIHCSDIIGFTPTKLEDNEN